MVARLGAIPVQRALVSALLVLASLTKASPGGLTADSAAKFALEASGGAPNRCSMRRKYVLGNQLAHISLLTHL